MSDKIWLSLIDAKFKVFLMCGKGHRRKEIGSGRHLLYSKEMDTGFDEVFGDD
ncbi:hypothetical protein LOH54_05795 [Sulfurimonas sp. HSL-3221]|uniref:hypothetical protein n=1 Tax=Thiomicrolovo sulfuroxydans TaxID=2894755 RepID=UPI001E2B4593|nr:hypothetical protein [Sulfurimonas sp. HSL-3221]UFS63643.1 hypothetical protein LOH54_05795 [Sulfurimonas sp. HSL-3221]